MPSIPQFRRDLFQVPLWVGSVEDDDLIESAKTLAYKFRDRPGEKGLVSDSWNRGEKSTERERQDKQGVTSFYSENLVANKEWDENLTKIVTYAGGLLSDTHELDLLKGMRVGNAWVTIYPQEAYVPQHIHAGFWVSGVYYVKAEESCGEIIFQDPAWLAKSMTISSNDLVPLGFPAPPTGYQYAPKTGDLLLFPSWLPHNTNPNLSEEDRIICSFNLIFPKQNQYHRDIARAFEGEGVGVS